MKLQAREATGRHERPPIGDCARVPNTRGSDPIGLLRSARMTVTSDAALHRRRALVTGGGAGIGASIAEALTAAGAEVRTVDADALTEADYIADISDDIAVVEIFERLDRDLGGLDILVNNVGIAGENRPGRGPRPRLLRPLPQSERGRDVPRHPPRGAPPAGFGCRMRGEHLIHCRPHRLPAALGLLGVEVGRRGADPNLGRRAGAGGHPRELRGAGNRCRATAWTQ